MFLSQWPKEQSVGEDPEHGHTKGGCNCRGDIIQTEQLDCKVGKERAEHIELAMGEIDDVQDAEDQCQACRDQYVGHPIDHAVGQLLGENVIVHWNSPVGVGARKIPRTLFEYQSLTEEI